MEAARRNGSIWWVAGAIAFPVLGFAYFAISLVASLLLGGVLSVWVIDHVVTGLAAFAMTAYAAALLGRAGAPKSLWLVGVGWIILLLCFAVAGLIGSGDQLSLGKLALVLMDSVWIAVIETLGVFVGLRIPARLMTPGPTATYPSSQYRRW